MKKTPSIVQPVFFIGMGRSGTTILFEALTQHKEVAWPSNYCEWMPSSLYMNALLPMLDMIGLRGHKKQYGIALPGNRYLPQPDEAYKFWDYYTQENFSRSYLNNVNPTKETILRVKDAVYRVMRWQRKARFAAKFTGPGRVAYLAKIFPDAHFIHVIRDGRSVVESLLRQNFWIEKDGLEKPFWDGTPKHIINEWISSDKNSDVLTAIQWRYIIESIRKDFTDLPDLSYMEVRYEDFVAEPDDTLESIYHFSNLAVPDSLLHNKDQKHGSYRNMNEKWRELDKQRLERITIVMQPMLQDLGYV